MLLTLFRAFVLFGLFCFGWAACNRKPESQAGPNPTEKSKQIVVGIAPLATIIRELLPPADFQVHVLLPPAANPALFAIRTDQLVLLSKSEFYFMAGVPFEYAWQDRIQQNFPGLHIVNTGHLARTSRLVTGTHAHEDPHFWLSIIEVRRRLLPLSELLQKTWPQYKAIMQQRLMDLDKKLEQQDHSFKQRQLQGLHLLVFHPSWSYFARDYGFHQHHLELEGQDASITHVSRLHQLVRQNHIGRMIQQPEFPSPIAHNFAAQLRLQTISISPMDPDWLTALQCVADTVQDLDCK
ncbi:MAG: zinc ABC transporter substrate-binding protein [Leptospiraceae bacterium]|nr:zinc ABC transporter substrate-binding protein [Leptospiraceae bacterium]